MSLSYQYINNNPNYNDNNYQNIISSIFKYINTALDAMNNKQLNYNIDNQILLELLAICYYHSKPKNDATLFIKIFNKNII